MLVIYANDYHLHVPKYEIYDGKKTPHAEQPDRIARIIESARTLDLDVREFNDPVPFEIVSKLHEKSYIEYLRNKCSEIRSEEQLMPSVFIKDTYTPLMRHTYEASLKSANLAVQGSKELKTGKQKVIYALCRPPGHHAEKDAMSGYCYFNNAALAANELSMGEKKVAILDIDYHHGNGTQKLFYDRNDVFYVSIHAEPEHAFPYSSGFADEKGFNKGKGFNLNLPMPPETTPALYISNLEKALDSIKSFNPDYLVVSLGYDTYEDDPIGGLGIDEDSYKEISRVISGRGYPTLLIQEGGYNIEKLGVLSKNFMQSFTIT